MKRKVNGNCKRTENPGYTHPFKGVKVKPKRADRKAETWPTGSRKPGKSRGGEPLTHILQNSIVEVCVHKILFYKLRSNYLFICKINKISIKTMSGKKQQ